MVNVLEMDSLSKDATVPSDIQVLHFMETYRIVIILLLLLPEISAQVISHSDSTTDNLPQPISQKDHTIRVDPLDNFKKYKGGFNITNKHYWSSVFFTGIYGYAVGVLLLFCGVLFVTIDFCGEGIRNKKIFPSNFKGLDVWPVPLAIMHMILAMVFSGLVIACGANFNYQARTSVNIIIKTTNEASEIIHNATEALKEIHEDLMESNVAVEAFENLDSTADKFNSTAENIIEKAAKNKLVINKALKVVFVITIVIISLYLIVVISLSVFGVLKFWRVLYMLVIMCCLVIVICWLLFGVYLVLENFSNDVCTYLLNFEENPYNNSISYLHHCDELLSAKPVLSEIGGVIYNLVNEVNSNISNLQGTLLRNVVYICSPFTAPPEYLYRPNNCPLNTIQIGDIPKVLKPYTCFEDDDEKCSNEDFISYGEYKTVESYTSSIQDLLNVYPCMEELIECKLVKDAIDQIVFKHCKLLKGFAKLVWLGMVILALNMMLLVVLWMAIKTHYDEHSHDVLGSVT
ncbi:unnamed protein product [Vicia faba]|uniref:Uncharacterized protein n=1 Tax=Vicia faba TaxID=3906 RepID=A0AAV1B2C4_VICFA|nr:unnamed protein product [Vicia faba]